MKKNFFKKLSFVLALAMIVSVLAPAAGAFAAAKAPKLSASTKYLYLGQKDKNDYDFNIANKQTGWKYLWSSSNEKVADINAKNGLVTATAAGKSTISVVITDKDGEEIDELTATVIVRDNIKELTITNLPTDNKLAVGATQDLNRSYVTFAGKKTGSEAKVAWTVTKDGKATTDATIDGYGKFTAKAAGEYVVELRAFQSSAKRTAWVSDPVKYASYVTSNVASAKITVAPSMVKVAQTTLNKFDLTFDSAVVKADVEKNLSVAYVLSGTNVKESVKSVTMSADNKTATVEMYLDFTKGATYVVSYPNMKSVQFVAATTKVEDVVEMAITTKTAQVSKEQKIEVALYNKDKVNIANTDLLSKVTLEKSNNNLVTLVGKSLYMYKVGESVTLTATYHTYNWKDGKEIGNVTATGDVTCVEVVKDQAGTIYGWSATNSVPTNFNTPKTQVFKNSTTLLRVVLKGKNAAGDDMYTANYSGYPNATLGAAAWKYTSSNNSVILVDPSTGSMYGVSEGTAVVVVSYNDVQVGACEITVTGARKVAMATLSTNSLVLSNKFSDPTAVTFEVKDQLGDDYKVAGAWNATAAVTANGTYTHGPSFSGLTFNAFGADAGTYGYTVKITDGSDSNVSISLNLTVTVQDPGAAAVSYYKIETDKVSYDVKSGDTAATTTASLSVYGYTAAGIKTTKLANGIADLTALGSTITVKNPDGDTVTGSAINATPIINSNSIVLAGTKSITVSGTARTIAVTEKTGSWLITATNATSGSTVSVSPISFEVKNTQTKVTPSVKRTVAEDTITTAADPVAVINNCLTFTVGDKTLTAEAAFVGVEGTNFVTVGKSITLKKIKLYEQIASTGVYIEHEVDMNGMVISVK